MSTAADMRGGGGERATWETCGVPERIVVEKGGNKGEAMVRAVPGAREGVFFPRRWCEGEKVANAQTTGAGGCRAQSLIMMGPVSLGSFNYMGRFVQTAVRLP